jgi:hypothetical protein
MKRSEQEESNRVMFVAQGKRRVLSTSEIIKVIAFKASYTMTHNEAATEEYADWLLPREDYR